MAVIKATAPRPRHAEGVFDLSDLRKSAERTLAEAQEEATRLVAAARAEVERVYSESRESGFEQGKADGYEAGLAEGRAKGEATGRAEAKASHEETLRAVEESFAAELMRWSAHRDEVMRSAERELAAIAIAIAESIVRGQVRVDPKVVTRQVEAAVALFGRATRLSVEVAPEDEGAVREAMPDLCALLPADAELSVRSNPAVSHGGCVVRSAEGSVDARIETQFRRMRFGVIGEDAAPAVEVEETPATPAAIEAAASELPPSPPASGALSSDARGDSADGPVEGSSEGPSEGRSEGPSEGSGGDPSGGGAQP